MRRTQALRAAGHLVSVAIVTLFAALPSPRAVADDPAQVEGPHCVVIGEKVSSETLATCRDLVEREVPILEGLPWRMKGDAKLVVRLFSDAEDYRRLVRANGAGAFADNLAATIDLTGESAVVLQPRTEPEVLALVGGLPSLTRELVAHELFHQWVLKADAAARPWWPDWYAEGMAEWTAERTLRAAQPAGVPVLFFEDRADQVRHAAQHDRALSLRRLLHVETLSYRPIGDVYTHAWSLVRLLGADAERFRDLQSRVAALVEPPQGDRNAKRVATARAMEAALAASFGPLDALEKRWAASNLAEKPAHAIASRSAEAIAPETFLATAFAEDDALLLFGPPPRAAFSLTGRMRILPVGTRQADLVIAHERREAPRLVKLAIGPGYVTLLAFADGFWQERYRKNAAVAANTFPLGQPLRFALAVASARLTLEIEGKKVFEGEVPPGFDVERGAWGVGCNGSAVVFDELKTAPLPLPPK